MADEHAVAAEAAREDQERTAKRRRRWGCLVWVAILILLPAAIVGMIVTAFFVMDEQAASAAIERGRKAGDPLTPKQMQAYYGATPESDVATRRWSAVLESVKRYDEDPAMRSVPVIGTVRPTFNERGLYDDATLALVEPYLAGSGAETLRLAHAARDLAPHVRYPIAFEQGMNARQDAIQESRHLANLLVLEAEMHAAHGDPAKATESLLTLVAVSETFAEQPDVIAYLVRVAIFGVATYHGMNLVDAVEFSPEELQRLQEAYGRQAFHRQLLRAVSGHQLQAVLYFDDETPAPPGMNDSVRSYPLRGQDLAMTLDLNRQFLEDAEGGFAEADRAAATLSTRLDALQNSTLDQYRYAVTLDAQSAYWALVNAGLRAEAQARLCAVCCACERYRQEHGAWPPTLEAIVPEYLAAVPLDPVDEQPLRYAVEGEKMTVHSIAFYREENQLVDTWLGDGLASFALDESYVPRKY